MTAPLRAVASVAAALHLACGGPFLMLPGGTLSGEEVETPVSGWSDDESSVCELETRPEDPYSVQINCTIYEGHLYIDPAEGRRWLEHIRRDARVRVRLDGRIYRLRAVRVTDPEELARFAPDRFVYRLEPRT